MKLTIREDSKNYTCTVVKLPVKQKVEGLDNLVKVTVFGNDVLTKKDADESQLYLFFPAECQLAPNYIYYNNEYRNNTENKDQSQKGYFEQNCRVKAIKFKGVISTGYLAPVSTLSWLLGDKTINSFKEGDEFTDIDRVNICKKYVIKHIQTPGTKESRYNKKLKRFDKLVPNQFRFHTDTSQLARNLHVFHPEDIIVITDKWHGTSAVFANLLIKKELKWYERLAIKLGIPVNDLQYDDLYSSRSVIKNRYINKEATAGFYGEDIWAVVHNEIKSKIEPGISLYGEIVGFLPSGKHIQKGYDYGCSKPYDTGNGIIHDTPDKEHKFMVYRITYTKPDGNVIEFSWQQIKNYCQKYQLEHVKELYFGSLFQFLPSLLGRLGIKYDERDWSEKLFEGLSLHYLEKDCKWCINKVPAEGICVRRDGLESYSTYKLKSKRFLERETKELDRGEVNIEEEQNA